MVDDLDFFHFILKVLLRRMGQAIEYLLTIPLREIDLNSELKTKSQILTKIPIFVNVSTPIGL